MNCTPGGLGDRLSMLRQPAFYGGAGDGGVMQRVLRMPLPEDQLGEFGNRRCSSCLCGVTPSKCVSPDLFFNELVSRHCIPCFIWDNDDLLNHIQNIFHECDNSIMGVVRRLKTELSRYFMLPGKFIVVCVLEICELLPHISI
jgi:hypothetical protein